MLVILLMVTSLLPVTVICDCGIVTVQVSKRAILTVDVPAKGHLILVTHNGRSLLFESKSWYNTSYEFIKHTEEKFSFKIMNAKKNDAGIYKVQKLGSNSSYSCIELVITDKPVTFIPTQHQPVLRQINENDELKGKITLICNARSTTLPIDHNLPMIYRWFKHGIYYDNGRILQDTDVDITDDKGGNIICIATDDPDCKTSLQDLTKWSTLNIVLAEQRCKHVLGVSENFTLHPMYGPYDIQLMYNDTNLQSGEEIQKCVGELSVNCMSDCNPACNISWYKDGKMLSNNLQLNLPDLQESDDGVYTCRVYNIHGTRNIYFILNSTNTTTTTITTTTYKYSIPGVISNSHLGYIIAGSLLIAVVFISLTVFLYRKYFPRNIASYQLNTAPGPVNLVSMFYDLVPPITVTTAFTNIDSIESLSRHAFSAFVQPVPSIINRLFDTNQQIDIHGTIDDRVMGTIPAIATADFVPHGGDEDNNDSADAIEQDEINDNIDDDANHDDIDNDLDDGYEKIKECVDLLKRVGDAGSGIGDIDVCNTASTSISSVKRNATTPYRMKNDYQNVTPQVQSHDYENTGPKDIATVTVSVDHDENSNATLNRTPSVQQNLKNKVQSHDYENTIPQCITNHALPLNYDKFNELTRDSTGNLYQNLHINMQSHHYVNTATSSISSQALPLNYDTLDEATRDRTVNVYQNLNTNVHSHDYVNTVSPNINSQALSLTYEKLDDATRDRTVNVYQSLGRQIGSHDYENTASTCISAQVHPMPYGNLGEERQDRASNVRQYLETEV